MSRGFVREGDQEEDPIIAPRAPLPDGAPNYVTLTGMESLETEMSDLEAKKAALKADPNAENRLDIRVTDIEMAQLLERLRSAQVISYEPDAIPEDARFGAWVTYRLDQNKQELRFQIVGVDEADVSQGKIAYTAPIAKALIGLHSGEEAPFQLGAETRNITVVAVEYS